MPKNVTQYDLLISCPGDIDDRDISAITKAVNEFNSAYEDVLGLRVRIKHWTKDAFAESGGKPQELLNNQFVRDCDAAVALFWTRFGTPTDTYGSGTEEEIEIMLEAGKQVFVGFSTQQVAPEILTSDFRVEEYRKIEAYKAAYKERGIYFSYSSSEELEKIFYAHLSKFFLSLSEISKLDMERHPLLSVKTITMDGFDDTMGAFAFSPILDLDNKFSQIKELYRKISSYDLNEKSIVSGMGVSFQKEVELDENIRETITMFAEKLKIPIDDSFFSLGNLRKDMLGGSIALGYGATLHGDDAEIKKYDELRDLKEKIDHLIGFSSFEQLYKDLRCTELAVLNEGTTFDEDIDIFLYFPKDMIIEHRHLPVIDSFALRVISDNGGLELFFGIAKTAQYNDFGTSQKPLSHYTQPMPSIHMGLMGYSDPVEDFYESLDDIFDYEYFEEKDAIILKLHLDYIKHNTATAFPSIIFLNHTNSDVRYAIKSKHFRDEIQGRLKAKV